MMVTFISGHTLKDRMLADLRASTEMPTAFHVHSDLYHAGRNEDGELVEGERFFVVATFEDGHRLAHNHAFTSLETRYDPDEGVEFFVARRAEAEREANALCDRIRAHGAINQEHWTPWFPEYGSAAYSDADAKAWERRVDEESR